MTEDERVSRLRQGRLCASRLVVLMLALAASAGCDSTSSDSGDGDEPDFGVVPRVDMGPQEASVGESCSDLSCEAGLSCESVDPEGPHADRRLCTAECEGNEDCPSTTVCGTLGGRGACLPDACAGRAMRGIACVDGSTVACADVEEGHCRSCGCRGDERCLADGSCRPPAAVGERCHLDEDCASGNCSPLAGLCRLPVGAPCRGTVDCDHCIWEGDYTFCSRRCDADADCDGNPCIGRRDQPFSFICLPPCDDDCPSSIGCDVTGDGSTTFCDCLNCDFFTPPVTLGHRCNTRDDRCEDGFCLARPEEPGLCTRTCGTSADCGAGAACVNVPCGEGSPSECGGLRCMVECHFSGACFSGTCGDRVDETGAEVPVCNP